MNPRWRFSTIVLLVLILLLPAGAASAQTGAAAYRTGSMLTHANLTVVPLYAKKTDEELPQEYLTLEEATELGVIAVTELEGNTDAAQVNAVHVTSTAKLPIFLMAGEVILGGKQDRIISNNTLVPPKTRRMRLEVFCVEQGRWNGRRAEFRAAGKISHSKLRQTAQFDAPGVENKQQEVWNEVAKRNKKSKVAPSTGTYRATLEKAAADGDVDAYVDAILPRLKADPKVLGVIVAIDGSPVALDAFASPKLFAKVRDGLVASYALEASGSEKPVAEKPEADEADDFLETALKGEPDGTEKSGAAENTKRKNDKGQGVSTKAADSDKAIHEFYRAY